MHPGLRITRIAVLQDFRGIKMEEIAGTEKHIKLLFIGELSPTPQMWLCGEKQSVQLPKVTLSDWSRWTMSPRWDITHSPATQTSSSWSGCRDGDKNDWPADSPAGSDILPPCLDRVFQTRWLNLGFQVHNILFELVPSKFH